MSNHQKGTDTNQARQAHIQTLIADAAANNVAIQNNGPTMTLILPDGSVREMVFRYSNYTANTGFSFIFRRDDFGANDLERYFIFALVEQAKTRYLMIRHDEFKKIMEKPLSSESFQTSGQYSFNFARSNPKQLGKWGSFVRSWKDLIDADAWILFPKSQLGELANMVQQINRILNNYM